jgi:hypothetical protein
MTDTPRDDGTPPTANAEANDHGDGHAPEDVDEEAVAVARTHNDIGQRLAGVISIRHAVSIAERQEMTARVKRLYRIRSDYVHGNPTVATGVDDLLCVDECIDLVRDVFVAEMRIPDGRQRR